MPGPPRSVDAIIVSTRTVIFGIGKQRVLSPDTRRANTEPRVATLTQLMHWQLHLGSLKRLTQPGLKFTLFYWRTDLVTYPNLLPILVVKPLMLLVVTERLLAEGNIGMVSSF